MKFAKENSTRQAQLERTKDTITPKCKNVKIVDRISKLMVLLEDTGVDKAEFNFWRKIDEFFQKLLSKAKLSFASKVRILDIFSRNFRRKA